MNTLQPPKDIIDIVNESRATLAEEIERAGTPDARLLVMAGACAVDGLRMPGDGRLAAVRHAEELGRAAATEDSIHYIARLNGDKPRTRLGYTGLIHQPGGAGQYTAGAAYLGRSGVPVAAEVMGDIGAAVSMPYLTAGWVGARNIGDTTARYAGRPTEEDRDYGIHPLPMWVKHDQDGSLDSAINALHTLRSDTPESRLRLDRHGNIQNMRTYGNPHSGLILRGSDIRPYGPLDQIMAHSITTARERLDADFGKDTIPIIVDASHAHANKWAEGGERGQLSILQALGNLLTKGVRIDGVMAETYIHAGKQAAPGTEPGVSITDPCIRQPLAIEAIQKLAGQWSQRPQFATTR